MKILLAGACGKMGKATANLLYSDGEITAYLLDRRLALDKTARTYPSYDTVDEKVDVVIDFSTHILTREAVKYCVDFNSALLVACTGQTESESDVLKSAAKSIPLALMPNGAVGHTAVKEALRRVLDVLPDYDVEIIETHSDSKIDCPSGTAKDIFKVIAERKPDCKAVAMRTGARKKNEVGIFSVRGAGAVGEHEIRLFGAGERLTIIHSVFDREAYARGVIAAAKNLAKKPAGTYSAEELI
jgi:4-hydroxy-tetrahydrodipicolinate reductase